MGLFAALTFIFYGLGFIIWNQYLIPFGFFEYNLLQVRFLGAGSLFVLVLFIVMVIVDVFIKLFGFKISGFVFSLILFLLAVFLFYPFQYLIFARIPQWLGGARPIPTTILGSEQQISYLGALGVKVAANAEGKNSIQTGLVCLVYQNDRYILFQTINLSESVKVRNVPLSRDQFIGFSSVDPKLSAGGCPTL